MKTVTTTFVIAAATLLLATTAQGEVHRWEFADCYLPDGLAKDAVAPVLIVEKGLAEKNAKLWASLRGRGKFIVVEAHPPRGMPRRMNPELYRGSIEEALAFAKRHHPVERCPWVLLAFSDTALRTARFAFEHPDRYQGLLLVNPRMQAKDLPGGLGKARDLRVGILHGSKDPVCKPGWAEGLRDRLRKSGLDVDYELLETRDHTAPLGEPGVDFIAKFLARFDTTPEDDREPDWKPPPRRMETTDTAGGIQLVADLYETGSRKDPLVLLFHQARSSRGEYLEIAPRLVGAGYNCLAVDQRSGKEWEGVENLTAKLAARAKLPRAYEDARPDLERAVAWVRELGFTGKLAVWGSSYSAALVLFVAAGNQEVSAVVSFSPGDYLEPRGSVFGAARKLAKPILIVCPPKEEKQARRILEAVKAAKKSLLVQPGGVHGSSTLYRTDSAEEAWEQVLAFLAEHIT